VVSEGWTLRLAAAIAAELGLRPDDSRAEAMAAMVIATMGLRERVLSSAILDGVGARTIERRVRSTVDESFARLERAFGDIDRPAG
jgi:hypothetical protein